MMMNYLIVVMLMLLSIAFFTILERKFLGILHIRLGPSKVGLFGIFQPFSDALKLFSKNMNLIYKSNELMWSISPIFMFCLIILFMNFIPLKMMNMNMSFSMLLFVTLLGMSIFPLFWSSLFSFSKFSLISSKRSISQMISYEMGLMFLFMILILLLKKNNILMLIFIFSSYSKNKIIFMSIIFILIVSESSRIPFDFIESESELVSGFNTEFSSSFFSMFFLYEYGMMLIIPMITSIIFNYFLMFLIMVIMFILIRGSFPRMRYDQMMNFFWKYFLFFFISFSLIL